MRKLKSDDEWLAEGVDEELIMLRRRLARAIMNYQLTCCGEPAVCAFISRRGDDFEVLIELESGAVVSRNALD